MVLLRLAAYLLAAVIGAALLLYLLTGRRNYLRVAGRSLGFGVVLALVFVAFYVLERLI